MECFWKPTVYLTKTVLRTVAIVTLVVAGQWATAASWKSYDTKKNQPRRRSWAQTWIYNPNNKLKRDHHNHPTNQNTILILIFHFDFKFAECNLLKTTAPTGNKKITRNKRAVQPSLPATAIQSAGPHCTKTYASGQPWVHINHANVSARSGMKIMNV